MLHERSYFGPEDLKDFARTTTRTHLDVITELFQKISVLETSFDVDSRISLLACLMFLLLVIVHVMLRKTFRKFFRITS